MIEIQLDVAGIPVPIRIGDVRVKDTSVSTSKAVQVVDILFRGKALFDKKDEAP